VIEKKRFRTRFLKNLRTRDKELTGVACRDGKGGIMLILLPHLSKPGIGISHWQNPQDAE
jgi:hypothetical protein